MKVNHTILSCLFGLICCVAGNSQTIANKFVGMPDSILPYLARDQRQTMVNYYNLHTADSVKNALNGKSRIDSLSNFWLQASLSQDSKLEMMLIPVKSDTLTLMIITVGNKYPESNITIYNHLWQTVPVYSVIKVPNATELLAKPDSMSAETFDSLKKSIDFTVMSARLSDDKKQVVFSIQAPQVDAFQQNRINKLFREAAIDIKHI